MVLKFRTFPDGGGGWFFIKFGRPKMSEKIKVSQSSLKLKLEIIIDRDSNMRAFTYFYFLNVIVFRILNFVKTGIGQ